MQLSKAEEELMNYLWKLDKAFMKDLLNMYSLPKPAATTTATLLKRMKDKGFISYDLIGRSRRYFPLIKKRDYFSKHLNSLIKNFFNNNASQFASFFAEETKLTRVELESLRKLIDDKLKKE